MVDLYIYNANTKPSLYEWSREYELLKDINEDYPDELTSLSISVLCMECVFRLGVLSTCSNSGC